MGQTRPATEVFLARAKRDPGFCEVLLDEARELVAEGDVQTADSIIRFVELASTDDSSTESTTPPP